MSLWIQIQNVRFCLETLQEREKDMIFAYLNWKTTWFREILDFFHVYGINLLEISDKKNNFGEEIASWHVKFLLCIDKHFETGR